MAKKDVHAPAHWSRHDTMCDQADLCGIAIAKPKGERINCQSCLRKLRKYPRQTSLGELVEGMG